MEPLSTDYQHIAGVVANASRPDSPNGDHDATRESQVSVDPQTDVKVQFHVQEGIRSVIMSTCLLAPTFLGSCGIAMFVVLAFLECLLMRPLLQQAWPSLGLVLLLITGYGVLYVVSMCMEIQHQQCTITSSSVLIRHGWFYQMQHRVALDQVRDLWVDGDTLTIGTKSNDFFVLRAVDEVEQVRLLIWTRKEQMWFFGCCHQGQLVLFNEAA